MTLNKKIEALKVALKFYADGENLVSPETSKMPDETFEYMFDNHGWGGAYVENGNRAKKTLASLPEPISEDEISKVIQSIVKMDFGSGVTAAKIIKALKSAGCLLVRESA